MVHDMVSALTPADPIEAEHRSGVLRWLEIDAGHTDVSLWFVIERRPDQQFTPDRSEFPDLRWWTSAALRAADPDRFDPHLIRFDARIRQPDRRN